MFQKIMAQISEGDYLHQKQEKNVPLMKFKIMHSFAGAGTHNHSSIVTNDVTPHIMTYMVSA